ncbi:hypothetical protein [Streptomyces sp. NBC_00443]|uniref:hypothetical protein n=1 Tax=Streptomyces sp. NBC_00443 TaxID=2975743 RepID=UPI002E237D73
MAGKMWCCGGGSSSGGGSGGLAAVATTDTPTVDLSGDGTVSAPISAAVIVAPEPNGVEAAAGGLLVAPSADTGNTLSVGSDGRLFVPAGGAPLTVEDSSTVDLTITPSGALRADVIPGSVTIPTVYASTVEYRSTAPPATYSGVTIPEAGVWAVQIDTYWSATHTGGGVYTYTNDLRIGHVRGGALIAQYNDVWGPTLVSASKNAGQADRGTTSQSYVGPFLAGDQIALYNVHSNATDATFTFTPRVTMFKVSD